MLTEQTQQTIDHWVSKFPQDKKRSALIQALIAAQEQNGGWITRELTEAVAHYLDVPTQLVVYPGEPHGLTTHENRLAKITWDLAWFDKYLLGKE